MTMTQKDKTKEEFIEKIRLLQKRIAELEIADAESKKAESIIETVREPLIVLNADLKIISANKSFYQTFKVAPNETEGRLIYDLGNRQWDIPKLRKLLEEILPKSSIFENYEIEHNFETIGPKIMLLNARRIYRETNKTQMILLAIEDITERKEIEAGLEKTRKELAVIKKTADEASEFAESVINTVREPLISLDQDLRVVTVSHSFYAFFKVKPEETVGQLIYDLGNKQWDIPKLRELLETILPQKTTFDNYEVEHDFTTIGRRIMLLNARQIQRASGKERIILLAIEDITERKEIEAGLEKTRKELEIIKQSEDESREYSESIIDTVREPLIVLNQDLRVVTASRSFYEFFKVKPEETVGQLIYDLGNKQWNIPKLRELLETILPQKATFDNYEVEHDFADIGKRTMLLNARQIQRASGKERIILLASEDITERKRLEEAIKSDTEMKSKFTSMVSHELRSPLGAIKEGINLVLEGLAGNINDEQKDLLSTAKRNVDRLGRLINNVLDFQKIASGKIEFDIRGNDINQVVQEVNNEMRLVATEKGMDLAVDIDESIPKISFDKDRIIQVLTNLVSNAIKYTEKGNITISTKQEDGMVRVAVQDTGIGIKAEDIKKLFRVFEQLDSTRDKKKGGTGLGLAISNDIILAHKGKIWAESEAGKGSTFYFTIPMNLKNKNKLGEILVEEKKITEKIEKVLGKR
jgi:PAS domain S-box-containing protein